MKKIIYTKYANDRAEAFAIRTDIVKDETGTRYVRKCFLDDKGKEHVFDMYKNYKFLVDLYADNATKIAPVACRKMDDGVEFDFVQGHSLDSILREYISKKQIEHLKQALAQYLELVVYDKSDVMFETSSEFEKVFGTIEEDWSEEKAVSCANIDMIPGNIIINDKWNIIDYEWMFDFKIPAKFVQYRCLHYWYHENKGDTLLSWDELAELISVTKEQQAVFTKMEEHFQRYLCEGIVPTREMREIIGQNIVTINEVNEELLRMNPIQIYYDTGSDFNEKESCKIKKANFLDKKIDFVWKIPADIKAIRIDPIEKACVCDIKKFEINGQALEFITNGIQVAEGVYNFETTDPWLISYSQASEGDILVVELDLDYEESACKALTQSHSDYIRSQNEKAAVKQANEVLYQEKLAVEQANEVLHQEKVAVENTNRELSNVNAVLNQRLHLLNLEKEQMTKDNEYLLDQFEQSQMEMADRMMKEQKKRNTLLGRWFG